MKILWKIVKRVIKGISILVGVFVIYLLIISLTPGILVPEQALKKSSTHSKEEEIKIRPSRKNVSFKVEETSVSAWLYMPKDLFTPVSCIIMANGIGGTKDMGLEAYAVRYQEAGFAVLAFDYRHFGESEGQPRQLIWIPYQLQDYLAAIEYARNLEEIDPTKIAIWGTSLSGGHVIVLAAKDKTIACVSAQCPGLDGRASAMIAFERQSIGYTFRMLMHGQRDLVRYWLGLSPHKMPIVGKPGTIALYTDPEAFDFFTNHASASFINEACARIIIRGDKYRPVKHARNVRCPILLQICDNDNITPKKAVEETEKSLGENAEIKHYPIGHFDIYSGDNFEKSVSDQIDFFKKHL